MEIFPPGTFTREAEVSMKSLNINYFAWWNDQYVAVLYIIRRNSPLHPIDHTVASLCHLLSHLRKQAPARYLLVLMLS